MSVRRKIALLFIGLLTLIASAYSAQSYLSAQNIPFGNTCAIMNFIEGDDTPKRVCGNGVCMLYSDWIKTPEGQKALLEKNAQQN